MTYTDVQQQRRLDDWFPGLRADMDRLRAGNAELRAALAAAELSLQLIAADNRDLAAANARAEAAEAANARCREANILLANSRNTAAEEWRTRAEAAEADAATCNHYATRALAAEAKLAAVPLEAIAACLRCIGHYAPHALGTYSPRTVAAWLEARGVQYQAAVELVEEQEEEETD